MGGEKGHQDGKASEGPGVGGGETKEALDSQGPGYLYCRGGSIPIHYLLYRPAPLVGAGEKLILSLKTTKDWAAPEDLQSDHLGNPTGSLRRGSPLRRSNLNRGCLHYISLPR